MTGQPSPVKQAALVASIAVSLLVGLPVLIMTVNTTRRGLLTLEQMAAAVGLFGMGVTFLFPIIFVGALFLLLYPGFFKGPALGAMIFPGLLSLWYVYDAVTKSEPYPWLAVAVLWVILWSIGFVTLFARKVGWKAGTALVKKLTAMSGSVVPPVAETAAPAPPPPLDAPPNKLGVIEKMEEELRSADLETRYRATVAQEQQDLERRWPFGCSGAGNAFLALVGPSMGRHTGPGAPALGGANRPYVRPMRIGRDAMNLDWGDHRKTRWTGLCAAMLGSQQYVSALTALLNLDWRNSTSEKAIPDADLQAGLRCVWDTLVFVRPRIVCALTNRVWDIMLPEVLSRRVDHEECPVALARKPIIFRLDGCAFASLFVKPHGHPSRVLSKAQIAELGLACEWFVGLG